MAAWSLVLIPDTQYLTTEAAVSAGYGPAHLYRLRNWIISNKETHNIQMVGHLGDIVDDGTLYPHAWTLAKDALLPLLNHGIPVAFPAGNHDGDNVGGFLASTFAQFNTHFGPHIYEGKPWFGGTSAPGDARNAYFLFTAEGQDFLLIQMEQYAGGSVLRWAREVAAAHPHRKVIILTHAFLLRTGERMTWTYGARSPADRWLGGDEMWDKYGLRRLPNLVGIFNGHFSGNLGYRVDTNDYGQRVLQGFYNFQWTAEGGKGRLILLTVDMEANTVHQRVVRTDTDEFEQGTDTDFDYDTVHRVDFDGSAEPNTYVVAGEPMQGVGDFAIVRSVT